LSLVIGAGQPQSTREVNQRRLRADGLHHVDGCLQRRQLPVCREYIEFRIVLAKIRARFDRFILAERDEVAGDGVLQRFALAGEVANDPNVTALIHHWSNRLLTVRNPG